MKKETNKPERNQKKSSSGSYERKGGITKKSGMSSYPRSSKKSNKPFRKDDQPSTWNQSRDTKEHKPYRDHKTKKDSKEKNEGRFHRDNKWKKDQGDTSNDQPGEGRRSFRDRKDHSVRNNEEHPSKKKQRIRRSLLLIEKVPGRQGPVAAIEMILSGTIIEKVDRPNRRMMQDNSNASRIQTH